MAEVKCVATRESYGNALKELAQNGADNLVVLDADLSAATKTAIFKNAFPDRHINCGIAESNMMSVAAGLSTMGYVPFASSFAMFAAGRAFEQIRNSVGYPHLNVKIGATHAGISVGEDGASHQCCELVKEGSDVTIIANGLMVAEAIDAAKELKAQGIDAEVINIATIKPLDTELIVKSAKKTGKVITVEEHNVIGGLGEAVCSALSESCPTPVKRIGINDVFGHSGPAKDLLKQFGLSAENIVKETKEFLGK